MSATTLKSHVIIKSLKNAGFDERQAETIVDVISEMHEANPVTKDELKAVETSIDKELKTLNQSVSRLESNMETLNQSVSRLESNMETFSQSVSRLETNMEWIKKLLISIGIAVIVAAVKYIFAL